MCGLNGFCEIKFGEEVCVCKKGFIGKNCQLNDPCDSKYSACNNNGECYSIIQLVNDVEEANFYCHCRAGYSGRNCESIHFYKIQLFSLKLNVLNYIEKWLHRLVHLILVLTVEFVLTE
jgi:hypothetical protein